MSEVGKRTAGGGKFTTEALRAQREKREWEGKFLLQRQRRGQRQEGKGLNVAVIGVISPGLKSGVVLKPVLYTHPIDENAYLPTRLLEEPIRMAVGE